MSHITIKINTDNAAFDDIASPEITRILHELADKINSDYSLDGCKLRDINGNTVGEYSIFE